MAGEVVTEMEAVAETVEVENKYANFINIVMNIVSYSQLTINMTGI